jgi:hypothetical protein
MDKAEVARRQLGTALDMFLRGLDPVSVHCLAVGRGEIAEWLAETAGAEVFTSHVLVTLPHLTISDIKGVRRKHWNAFKHATAQKGKDRNRGMRGKLATIIDRVEHGHHVFRA